MEAGDGSISQPRRPAGSVVLPVDDAGKVTDDTRLRAALPTVQYLTNKGAKVALLAHFGRPKGEVKPELSLKPVAEAFCRRELAEREDQDIVRRAPGRSV